MSVCLCSFGEQVQLLHPFQQHFNDESGARILRLCQFQQKKTRIAQVGVNAAVLQKNTVKPNGMHVFENSFVGHLKIYVTVVL